MIHRQFTFANSGTGISVAYHPSELNNFGGSMKTVFMTLIISLSVSAGYASVKTYKCSPIIDARNQDDRVGVLQVSRPILGNDAVRFYPYGTVDSGGEQVKPEQQSIKYMKDSDDDSFKNSKMLSTGYNIIILNGSTAVYVDNNILFSNSATGQVLYKSSDDNLLSNGGSAIRRLYNCSLVND